MIKQNKEIKFQSTDMGLPEVRNGNRNRMTAVILFALVAAMVGLSFAADPLYRIFCKVTGYAGTTRVAVAAPTSKIIDQMITVRFDANVNKSLPWRFKPVQNKIKVRLGEQALAFYEATNVSDQPIVGTAVFNVAPFKVGEYFNKIECFCFTEQLLKPGQTLQMPVTFFVDPSIVEDRNSLDVRTITLSYTFFASEDQSEVQKIQTSQAFAKEQASILSSREVVPKG
jgi:cytochrome c oxidase assembly protein subunit 11